MPLTKTQKGAIGVVIGAAAGIPIALSIYNRFIMGAIKSAQMPEDITDEKTCTNLGYNYWNLRCRKESP